MVTALRVISPFWSSVNWLFNHILEYTVQYCYISKSLDRIDNEINGNEMEWWCFKYDIEMRDILNKYAVNEWSTLSNSQ